MIQPGDTGLFVTCHRDKEVKCAGEVKDLLDDYADRLYPQDDGDNKHDDVKDEANGEGDIDDIEKEIQAEVQDIRKPKTAKLFTPVHLKGIQCGKCFLPRDVRNSRASSSQPSDMQHRAFAGEADVLSRVKRIGTVCVIRICKEVLLADEMQSFSSRRYHQWSLSPW